MCVDYVIVSSRIAQADPSRWILSEVVLLQIQHYAVVLSCFKLADPTPCGARGDGWAGSPNLFHREARTRDGNNISGQHVCVTARSCTSTIHTVTTAFRIVYIDGLLRLLYANHPKPKAKGESMILWHPTPKQGWSVQSMIHTRCQHRSIDA
jgi:hypothetical protein